MKNRRNHNNRGARSRSESGAVLVVVLLIMMALMGLGMTALWMTTSNLQVGSNVNQRTNALYVAEAGIEHARAILNDPTLAPVLPLLLVGTNPTLDNVPTAVDAQGNPNGVGAIMVDPVGPPVGPLSNMAFPNISFNRTGTDTVTGGVMAATMGTYSVWIRNDASELRRGLFVIDNNNAVVVRSQGVAADGRTNVVIEVTMGPSPAAAANPNPNAPPPPVLCNSGKNACDDNTSTQSGVVVN